MVEALARAGWSIDEICDATGISAEVMGSLPEATLGRIEHFRMQAIEKTVRGLKREDFLVEEDDDPSLTPEQRAFLAAYRINLNIRAAMQAATKTTHVRKHYKWLELPAYKEAFEAATREGCAMLESEAVKRAMDGTLEPIYSYGKLVGHQMKCSDQMLIRLLEANMPEKYRLRIEHGGDVSVNIIERLQAGRNRLAIEEGKSPQVIDIESESCPGQTQ
jgi:hypothetical protein